MRKGKRLVAGCRFLILLVPLLAAYPQNSPSPAYTVIQFQGSSFQPMAIHERFLPEAGWVGRVMTLATPPTKTGWICLGTENQETIIALLNDSPGLSRVRWILRDSSGGIVAEHSTRVDAGHLGRVAVSEFFSLPEKGFQGNISFSSDMPLTVAAYRRRPPALAGGFPGYALSPVFPEDRGTLSSELHIPQVAGGLNYETHLELLNTGAHRNSGSIRLFGSRSSFLPLNANGQAALEIRYLLQPGGSARILLELPAGYPSAFAMLVPDPGTQVPASSVWYSFHEGDDLVSETMVRTSPLKTQAAFYSHDQDGRTAIAIANPGDLDSEITFNLLEANGSVKASARRRLPAHAPESFYLQELFADQADRFEGWMELISLQPIAMTALHEQTNQEARLIMSGIPIAEQNPQDQSRRFIVPWFLAEDQFLGRLILRNTVASGVLNTQLMHFTAAGDPWPVAGSYGSSMDLALAAGQSRQVGVADVPRLAAEPLRRSPANATDTEQSSGTPSVLLDMDFQSGTSAPCYYVADVTLADGAASGYWGLEILFNSGQRMLSGGINFGGAIAADNAGESFAGFNFDRQQVVSLELNAQTMTTAGFSPQNLGVRVLILDADKTVAAGPFDSLPTGQIGVHRLEREVTLNAGFYSINVRSIRSSPMATFQLGATTRMPNGDPAGFQGGAVVGGYAARDAQGKSISGYVGFCLGEPQRAELKTYRYDSIGPLVLRVKNSEPRVMYDSTRGYAPTISNVRVTQTYDRSLRRATLAVSFDFEDPDGDIVFKTSIASSATVEIGVHTPGGGGCTSSIAHNAINKPGVTSGHIEFSTTSSPSYQFSSTAFVASFQLIDAAGNKSNLISFDPGTSWYCRLMKRFPTPFGAGFALMRSLTAVLYRG